MITFNLARAAASPRHTRARWQTLPTHLIQVPARIASSARRMILHLPTDWPWESAWRNLLEIATGPPPAATA
ncbi:hypothetical protein YT1_p10068 (plasmid) [Rhodococcus ruber]|nr:hypothetical protein [Rhodococcus ruber]AXY49269.1 hypothetical protein YT1_p10068 [Rhodococcus ruber]